MSPSPWGLAPDPAPAALPDAAGLPQRWARRERFTVLDLDASGLEALAATLRAWLSDPLRCGRLRYAALLAHPLAGSAVAQRLCEAGLDARTAGEIGTRWPPPLTGVHRVVLADQRLQLSLAVGPARSLLPGWVGTVDAVYVPLHPDSRIDPAVIRNGVSRLARDGLAAIARMPAPPGETRTPVARDEARAALAAAGFRIVPFGSPPGASPPHPGVRGDAVWQAHRVHGYAPATTPDPIPDRKALVIGAGLAGCAAAYALAGRGWTVQRLGPAPDSSAAGSGQPMLAQHPSVTPDDALLSRLTRCATLLARSAFDATALRAHGRLQLMDPERAHRAAARLPSQWVHPVDDSEAGRLSGLRLPRGGLWLPMAGSASPRALCEAWTVRGVYARPQARVARLLQSRDGWCAVDENGRVLGEAPVAIIATGAVDLGLRRTGSPHDEPLHLQFGAAGLQLRPGRSTIARIDRRRLPTCTIGGEGHALPLEDGGLLIGPPGDDGYGLAGSPAAAGRPQSGDPVSAAAWRRYAALTGDCGPAPALRPGPEGLRLSARDHLPLVGPLAQERLTRQVPAWGRDHPPAWTGLQVASALGGRGLLWAVLAAEIIASTLEDDPLPAEPRGVRALRADRFVATAAPRFDTPG